MIHICKSKVKFKESEAGAPRFDIIVNKRGLWLYDSTTLAHGVTIAYCPWCGISSKEMVKTYINKWSKWEQDFNKTLDEYQEDDYTSSPDTSWLKNASKAINRGKLKWGVEKRKSKQIQKMQKLAKALKKFHK